LKDFFVLLSVDGGDVQHTYCVLDTETNVLRRGKMPLLPLGAFKTRIGIRYHYK
jgi:hypothetical protein